jgi:alpha-D-glucose phosphate-specific phosphoglucomutase
MPAASFEAIKFGTDGWRAIIGRDFTFENVSILTQATCDYFKAALARPDLTCAIGYDTRFLSKDFALEVAKVCVANNIKVIFSDKFLPTPALSFAVKKLHCDFGVVITASHNPPEFNGFKIKDSSGGAADTEITSAIEKLLKTSDVKKHDLIASKSSSNFKVCDLTNDYRKFLKSYLDLKTINRAKLRVLVDVMHGSGNGFIADCVEESNVNLSLMRSDINPSFDGSRPEPLPENLAPMISRMKKEKFDLGLVLDGDADRIAAMDSNGEFISPQVILCLLILHLVQDRKMTGAVVKTIVGSSMIDKICTRLKLKLFETPVGFKYISKLMKEGDVLIGGEEAGGIGFKNYIPERDGSLAGLLLLEMLAFRRCNINNLLADLKREFGSFYYTKDSLALSSVEMFSLANIKIPEELLGKKVVKIDKKDGLKFICEDDSWLMLRGSGTEPIVRVYSEAKTKDRAEKLISLGKKMI